MRLERRSRELSIGAVCYFGLRCAREGFYLQLIRELPELVEIDTRPEAEGMGHRLRRWTASGRNGLTDADANCSIDRFLERNTELLRAPFQQSREISGLPTETDFHIERVWPRSNHLNPCPSK